MNIDIIDITVGIACIVSVILLYKYVNLQEWKNNDVYYLEYNRVVVGIFTSLDKAKDSIKGHEHELHIITKIPMDKVVSDSWLFIDKLGELDHCHWDSEDKIWLW